MKKQIFKKPARFCVLPDERGLILGIDKGEIFKRGVVYEVTELLGEIILKPIGKYALPDGGGVCKHSQAGEIIGFGFHLITLEESEQLVDSMPDSCGGVKRKNAVMKMLDK